MTKPKTPSAAELARRRKISRALKGKRRVFTEAHRRAISEGIKGNQNAVGHKVSPRSLANLLKNRKGRKINPKSLANLARGRVKKKSHAHPE